MSSVISGFEYDIFISYRQKDNRGDHWVTEFVNALKAELDATFKEDISIYFDENPHDGLLETHDVDKSLEGKLKCLIFIPIISQTYCDPKSFAWKSEFLAFKKIATEDALGLKIKLANGNVASRILPVRIHELDGDDKSILENEIGPLRSVDFIFKSAGVNRPLSPSDKRDENLNKSFYRDQINKTANAIKEIISAVSSHSSPQVLSTTIPTSLLNKNRKRNFIYGLSILALFVIGYFIYTRPVDRAEKSVAVLPFKTLSNDPDQKYFSFGIMEDIISRLYKIADLHVTSVTSALVFQNSEKNVREIAGELGVRYILEGSIQKNDTDVRISVRLVDAAHDENIWANTFDYKMSNAFALQAELAEKIANSLEIKLTQLEKTQINKTGTKSNLAFEYYQKGKFYNELSGIDNLEKSKNFFLKAIETDSLYAAAYSGLAEVNISFIDWGYASPNESAPTILLNIKKAIALDSLLGEAYSALGAYHIYCSKEYDQAEKAFKKGIRLNPGYDFTYFHYSVLQVIRKNQSKALELIQRAINLNPLSVKFNVYKVQMGYYMFREYDKALKELDKILAVFPADNFALWVQGTVYEHLGRYDDAEQSFLKRSVPTKNLNWSLACTYAKQGKKEEARKILLYLLEKEKKVYLMPTQIGCIYLELGDEVNAWKYFMKASDANDYWLIYYRLDPALDLARNDPRFKEILKKVNLND